MPFLSKFPRNPQHLLLLVLAALGGVLAVGMTKKPPWPEPALGSVPAPSGSVSPDPAGEACVERRLLRPTGDPMGIRCADVRRVIRQIRTRFPAKLPVPEKSLFAEGVSGWLDPYGLWSAAHEAPPRALVFAESERLLVEISGESDGRCEAAHQIGASLSSFMDELRALYDEALARAPRVSRETAELYAVEPVFDDGQVTTPARSLARELGRRLGALSVAYGESLEPYVAAGRARYFPALDADGWQTIVLAAALRAYVEAIDPHGQWAPLDEEWSLYAGDPSFYDPDRLWGDMLRTALGLRVVDQPVPPLAVDDLVLAVDGIPTTGLTFEQAEQLSRATTDPAALANRRELVVLRPGDAAPRTLELEVPLENGPENALGDFDDGELDVDLVPYGRSYAAVVHVPFVRDDLGVRLAEMLASLASDGPPEGILLDLRGNAGGSMDGATSALSIFLPDVPVFPMLHDGRLVEVLTTRGVDPHRFQGPLAVLVDGATASAAEMIAGALDRYRRAVLLGQPTYGKGCVQEYFEDDAGAGVLRLTTRLFTLPDGSPVQRLGLVPSIPLRMPGASGHEAQVPGSLDAVEGPDVRVALPEAPAWPSPSGRLGPCHERVVCSALEKAARVPARAFRSDFSAKGRRRGDPIKR